MANLVERQIFLLPPPDQLEAREMRLRVPGGAASTLGWRQQTLLDVEVDGSRGHTCFRGEGLDIQVGHDANVSVERVTVKFVAGADRHALRLRAPRD